MKCFWQCCSFALLALLPTLSLAAETAYRLGTGDEVRITVYGQPELTTDAQVSEQGTVTVALIGEQVIAGKTTAEAARLVAERYRSGDFLKNPQVNLLVTQYRSQIVSILGKVNRPGKLVLEGPTSLTQALAWAGGVAQGGSEKIVLTRVRNGAQERTEYDLQQLLNLDASDARPIWLQHGDTLYIPGEGRFYLNGEVNKPGMYLLDRPLNVMQALGTGGGPTARGSESSLRLLRVQPNGSVKELRAKPEDLIQDGDVLIVKESLF